MILINWLYILYRGIPPTHFRFVCKMQKCKNYALSTDLQWFKCLKTLHFTLQSFAKTRILPKKRLFCAFRKCPNGVLVRWKTRGKTHFAIPKPSFLARFTDIRIIFGKFCSFLHQKPPIILKHRTLAYKTPFLALMKTMHEVAF